MISTQEKMEIYEASKAQLVSWYGDSLAQQGACLYWAQVTMQVLLKRGHRAVLQAGDMLWKILPDGHGYEVDAFGYEWTPDEPSSREQIAQGLLPEVHIWAALPDDGEIVDFSTSYLADIARRQYGLPWVMPKPPEYIFGVPPANAFYRPHMAATLFVWEFIREKMAA